MKLRPHQQGMIEHMLMNNRCAVWCPMGGGKTLATLMALSSIRLVESDSPVLVVAPKRVAGSTWPDEIAKWPGLGLRCSVITGTPVERAVALAAPYEVFTINYELLPWLIEHWGESWPYRTVVLDESTKVKGFRTRQGTKRSKALGRIAHTRIDRIIELTGTPSPNGLKDLWGQLWFLDKGDRLGASYKAFTDRWFRTEWGGFDVVPLPHAHKEITERCRDVCLSVTLPFEVDKPIVTDIQVPLPPEVAKLYAKLERDMFVGIESAGAEVTAVNAAALSSKCQQLANGAVYDDDHQTTVLHDAKLEALDSIIEEAAGMPVLVAYTFKSDLQRLQDRYPKGRVLDSNPQTVTDWNAGKIPLLFLHPKSAGHGLNLQHGGNIIVWFGLTWNLEEYLQAIERIGPLRQWQSGLNRPCLVYRILTAGTVDLTMSDRLAGKGTVQQLLLDAAKRK